MEIKQFPKITVILRGYTYEQVRCVVKNLVGTRLNAVEITTNSPIFLRSSARMYTWEPARS